MGKTFKLILFCLPGILSLTALVLLDLYIHNFHTVIPKQVYRSRELSQQQFSQLIETYHIKSILNLRGMHNGLAWYNEEMQAVNHFRIKHYDLALHSKILPSPQDFNRLVSILMTAPKPLLIHCESGVDRTGLAAAIALILDNASLTAVEKQVSRRYFVLSDQSVGKQFLRLYTTWLAANHLQTSRENFLQWLHHQLQLTHSHA